MFDSSLARQVCSGKWAVAAYLLVGTLTAFLYFSLFAILWQILKIDYKISVSIAYLLAISFHFLLNRKYTFKVLDGNITPQIIRYLVMAFLNYLISLSVLEFSVKFLSLSPTYGVFIGIGVTLVFGFLVSKFWVFQVNRD